MKRFFLLASLFVLAGCHTQQQLPIVQVALYDTTSVFYTDFDAYPSTRNELPIGVFDSGTGGLTVLEAILASELLPGEDYIYLGDQANMPYGNYSAENKTDFLRELIMKDAFFLLGEQVKALVVACNTATAYGLEDISDYLDKSQSGVKAIGVIHAGVNATLDNIHPEEDVAVGVMATTGTIASGGYENTFYALAGERGYTGRLQVVNRGSYGFAEAVDGEQDFVSPAARTVRETYRGPSLDHSDFSIDTQLLPVYHFDFTNNRMVWEGTPEDPTVLQLNHAANYARYHLVSLVETLRKSDNPLPLQYLVLGCTHYPYEKAVLEETLQHLRNYEDPQGLHPYRDLLAPQVVLIDPALETARQLYTQLTDDNLLTTATTPSTAAFYISVPVVDTAAASTTSASAASASAASASAASASTASASTASASTASASTASASTASASASAERLDSLGRFTYAYKYGRTPGVFTHDVLVVPFSKDNIDAETIDRLKTLPYTWPLLRWEDN